MPDPVPATSSNCPENAARSSEPVVLWLRRGDQVFVGTLLVAAVVSLVIFWIRSTSSGRSLIQVEHLPARQYDYQLDMNESTWIEWTLLEGIGEKMARRIVADREARGRFTTVDDLGRVPGIGPKTLERLRPWLSVPEPKPVTSGSAESTY